MQNLTKSKRHTKLLAASAMALTLAIGGGLLTGSSAFAATTHTNAQAQSENGKTSGKEAFGHRGGGFFLSSFEEKLAAYLNLDKAALKEKLQTQTLAEIAEAQGISRDTLKAQLVAWIEAAKTAGDSSTTAGDGAGSGKPAFDASAIADKLLDSNKGWGDQGGRGAFGGKGGFELTAVADALGLTADEVKQGLQAGKTIAGLAAEQGVSTESVIDAVTASLKEKLNAALSEGKITQDEYDNRVAKLEDRAAAIVNQTHDKDRHAKSANNAQSDNNTTDGSSD
ncbi:hypothetical protein [Cohnella thermotolerans]|uniref:hypothetical protein n=1 Tax=Cohnella thermotolerans TaxID=329858 RepID=UPI000409E239|nr:hypothetical protein [Cohnella thermotolerans]